MEGQRGTQNLDIRGNSGLRTVKQKSDSYHCDQKADSGQTLRYAAFSVET